ncbi:hypothetical protein CYMTET_41304 [Cymbomonas tetramitiformis]|uniref:Uncharacterized protein n=1 Tax=Cymbomonas tetramitiformis TaxID=36881 RepID=A0AAE0C858_9CHLO|nr:hypothetical protein CYMTET_41304 [Cymbomonas tetramitiformis]
MRVRSGVKIGDSGGWSPLDVWLAVEEELRWKLLWVSKVTTLYRCDGGWFMCMRRMVVDGGNIFSGCCWQDTKLPGTWDWVWKQGSAGSRKDSDILETVIDGSSGKK